MCDEDVLAGLTPEQLAGCEKLLDALLELHAAMAAKGKCPRKEQVRDLTEVDGVIA